MNQNIKTPLISIAGTIGSLVIYNHPLALVILASLALSYYDYSLLKRDLAIVGPGVMGVICWIPLVNIILLLVSFIESEFIEEDVKSLWRKVFGKIKIKFQSPIIIERE